jgi:aspartyl-tRNA(Asn)/glutamyl-tRNA(Gln) amidotransferase subunit C
MAITAQDVIRVANLARLSLQPNEVEELTHQLGNIVGLVEQLADANTENIEPMVHAFELQNVLGQDQVVPSLSRESALQNAPSADEECFRVPAVLG